MSILVMEIFEAAKEAAERNILDFKKDRVIETINVEGDGINVIFHTGELEIIDFNDWCAWYNDVTKHTRNYKVIRPEDVTQWSVDPEMVLLYVRWELNYWGARLEDIEDDLRNEDYVE